MLDHIGAHLAEAYKAYLHMKSPFLGVVTPFVDYWFRPPVNNPKTSATETSNQTLHLVCHVILNEVKNPVPGK
ncbi:MAG TPA: hypothetical protein DEB17_09350 [Chlorobaculum sp.]|jgi:hypothetical protein|uniref:Uncharacterized protein n=1 Tax=Chlorobaculum tepidum (strain ATCC 49652 / DSM 12025 / NBRC 103806 / TLS) TaxID=194439 RepID=Q8KBB4_CHLTE|nr:hypothetical protein CT1875 [Chlorobaculum tepidum TLS]HBU24173.1 hypothetical protein [Chlorobaculum sp.]